MHSRPHLHRCANHEDSLSQVDIRLIVLRCARPSFDQSDDLHFDERYTVDTMQSTMRRADSPDETLWAAFSDIPGMRFSLFQCLNAVQNFLQMTHAELSSSPEPEGVKTVFVFLSCHLIISSSNMVDWR
mmetsp:Transcript_10580/g.25493  ORF Transcript_10580/g.25493 Transcript_10580/m.25493 type:complete len:129 (-) Transcript_10580:227-613(-)